MKSRMYIIVALILTIIFSEILFTGCSSNDKGSSKSMEQIQKEEGLPVVVQPVQLKEFQTYLTFYGQFKGLQETIVGAMIGGRIDKILVKPGTAVKKDQVIIRFPEDSPASQYRQAKSAYENSKKTYRRMKALYDAGEIAQAQYDGIATKYSVDKRNYETMKDMLELDAPYNGVLTELMVHEGDNVKSKTPLFTVAQLNKMKIRIWLSDTERMQIKKGMPVLARAGGKTFSGKVAELSMGVDPMKQAFSADLIFDNKSREILPGLTANVKVVLYKKEQAVVLPRSLVKKDASGPYVFLAKEGKAQRQEITIAHESGIFYEIGSGLKAGDPLIVEGNARLNNGSKIKVVK